MQLARDWVRGLSNLEMGAYYVEAGAWLVPALVNMGQNVEARRRGEDAVALADKVLEQRPATPGTARTAGQSRAASASGPERADPMEA